MNIRKAFNSMSFRAISPSRRRVILRHYHRLRGKEIVNLLHISKTGGTAIKNAVRNNTLTETHALILHSHNIRLADIPPGERVAFFLRDPVNRFISAFRFRLRQGKPRYDSPWTDEEATIFTHFHTPNELAVALSASDLMLRELAVYAMNSIGHVRQKQMEWFGSQSYLRSRLDDILLIGYQETLAQDFQRLKLAVGLPDEVTLPDDPVAANRSNTSGLDELDEQAVENIRGWYAGDYALIALCKEAATGIGTDHQAQRRIREAT